MSNDERKQNEMRQPPETPPPANAPAPGRSLPPEVQGQIGRQLRQVYGHFLAEPMPDKIGDLLKELKGKTPEQKP